MREIAGKLRALADEIDGEDELPLVAFKALKGKPLRKIFIPKLPTIPELEVPDLSSLTIHDSNKENKRN